METTTKEQEMTARYTVCDSCGHLELVTIPAYVPKCEKCNSSRLWDFATEKFAAEHAAVIAERNALTARR